MTRRRDLEHHRQSLGEIREIMNSMKTLAYMETRKLSRFLDAQQAVVQSVLEVAKDFLAFHPDVLPEMRAEHAVYLIIGSERGFCGDFNPALLRQLETLLRDRGEEGSTLIAVGRKLHLLLEKDARVAAFIDGPGVAEEVESVLARLVGELGTLQQRQGTIALTALHQGSEGGIQTRELLPCFQSLRHAPSPFRHPPLLNLPPAHFLSELSNQYLFSILHEILYSSLMAENHRRVAHLEGAVRHLDQTAEGLKRQCNALRQEEIIEEIEVILLSTSSEEVSGHPGIKGGAG